MPIFVKKNVIIIFCGSVLSTPMYTLVYNMNLPGKYIKIIPIRTIILLTNII